MADIDLHRVFGRLTPGSQWLLNQSNPPHALIEWRGPEPEPTQAQIDAEWALIEAEDAAQLALESQAQNEYAAALLVWRTEVATWVKNPSFDVDAWVDANVTDLSSAKTAIKHLGNALQAIASLIRANYLE